MSERTNISRTIDTVVQELDQLFTAAELKGPFVLVGHSMASLELLHYAQTFPTKVKAIVLLEGAPPKFSLTMKMPSDFEQRMSTFRFGLAKGNSPEIKSLVENANRVLQKGPFGDIPLVYFYAGANGISGWAEAQKGFSELSNRSESIFIKDANHFFYEENTDEILQKIGELL
jgi:pimeloyl-ACP methyl ester carboxylesterase